MEKARGKRIEKVTIPTEIMQSVPDKLGLPIAEVLMGASQVLMDVASMGKVTTEHLSDIAFYGYSIDGFHGRITYKESTPQHATADAVTIWRSDIDFSTEPPKIAHTEVFRYPKKS